MRKRWLWLIVIFGFLLDVVSKILVKSTLTYGVSKEILGNFLRFTYVENTGIIFGIASNLWTDNPILKNLVLMIFALIIVIFLLREFRRTQDDMSRILYTFIFTGALGNIFERIFGYIYYEGQWKLFYGRVVDFIDVGFGSHRWFFFNFADMFISVSIFLLLVRIFLLERKRKHENIP